MEPLIGHTAITQYLTRSSVGSLSGHAFLFVGPSHVGKRTLARWFSEQLHPSEVITLPLDEDASVISVKEDVRPVLDRIGRSTFDGGRRVIFIPRAHHLTPGAGNALLKAIEEPQQGTIFLLCTTSPDRLLPTIVSRCCVIRMALVPESVITRALEARGYDDVETLTRLSTGRPGIAIQAGKDEHYKKRWTHQLESLKTVISESQWQRALHASAYEGDEFTTILETALHLSIIHDDLSKVKKSFLFDCIDSLRELYRAPQLSLSKTALDRLLILPS